LNVSEKFFGVTLRNIIVRKNKFRSRKPMQIIELIIFPHTRIVIYSINAEKLERFDWIDDV
jgi:hypothetical protein